MTASILGKYLINLIILLTSTPSENQSSGIIYCLVRSAASLNVIYPWTLNSTLISVKL